MDLQSKNNKVRVADLRYFSFKDKVYYSRSKQYRQLKRGDRILQYNKFNKKWQIYYYMPYPQENVYTEELFQIGDLLYIFLLQDPINNGLYLYNTDDYITFQDTFEKLIGGSVTNQYIQQIINQGEGGGLTAAQVRTIVKNYLDNNFASYLEEYEIDLSGAGQSQKTIEDSLTELYLRTYTTPQMTASSFAGFMSFTDGKGTKSYYDVNSLSFHNHFNTFNYSYSANKPIIFDLMQGTASLFSQSVFSSSSVINNITNGDINSGNIFTASLLDFQEKIGNDSEYYYLSVNETTYNKFSGSNDKRVKLVSDKWSNSIYLYDRKLLGGNDYRLLVKGKEITSPISQSITFQSLIGSTNVSYYKNNLSWFDSRTSIVAKNIYDSLRGQDYEGIVTSGSSRSNSISLKHRIYYGGISINPQDTDFNNKLFQQTDFNWFYSGGAPLSYSIYTITSLIANPRIAHTFSVPNGVAGWSASHFYPYIALPVRYCEKAIPSSSLNSIKFTYNGMPNTDWVERYGISNDIVLTSGYEYNLFIFKNPQPTGSSIIFTIIA